MRAGFVDQILPRRPRSKRAVFAWMAFFLLFPLAYVGGSFLQQRDMRRNLAGISTDRGSAIATARQFLADRGLDAASWSAYASVDPSNGLMDYYRLHRDHTAAAAQSFSPAVRVRVLLISGAGDIADITLDPGGRLVGYDLTRVKAATTGAAVDESQARAIASAAVERIPNLTKVLSLGQPEIGTLEHTEGGFCRKFTWRAATPQLPGLTFEIVAPVCGTRAVGQTVKTTLDKDYAKAQQLGTKTSTTVLLTIYVIYIAIVLIYSFYRYARRAFEREVSHVRTLLLGVMIAAAFLLNLLTSIDEYVFGSYTAAQTIQWFPMVAAAVTFAVMGIGLAVAYEAGEGDLRELYPGKLTSLDALLRGKIFSRNVARSALFGTAYAGWMLLAGGAALFLLRPEAGTFTSNLLKVQFFRYPLLAIFVAQAVAVTLVPASGLLLPLGFLHRNVRRMHLRSLLLVIFVFLGCLITASQWGSLAGALLAVAMVAATLLGPFLALDFLAVTFSLLAWQVANMLARLVGLSPSLAATSIGVGCIALVFFAVAMWAALRGREYLDEEVKPLFARHMAERQLLEAEMAAARVAQLHLLPKTVPNVYGLSISAACIPARIVGGDFYDFFPLANDRLGIFIAEGSNRGIGSALNIALAKGFLMHTVRRNQPPHEVIMRLEAALGDLLAGASATTNVAYAVLDSGIGQIRYARTGEYPKVVVPSRPAKEIEIDMPGSDKAIYAATLDLRGGDAVLLFTDGIARRVRMSGTGAAEEMLRVLTRKRRESELEDDLTAVVVRVTRVGAAAMEVVA